MQVLSVNVSPPIEVPYRDQTIITGIYKSPVTGRQQVTQTNIAGDGQGDLQAHGGIDKAVYAYPVEHYDYWHQTLQPAEPYPYGWFGENLTVSGLSETSVCVGDRFRMGDILVEVSQPRSPCFKLAHKMDLPDFAATMNRSDRVGFYLRVLEEGTIAAGDRIEKVSSDPHQISIQKLHRLMFFDKDDAEGLRAALAVPALAVSWREPFSQQLARLNPQ